MMNKHLLFLILAALLPTVANADASGTCGANLTWAYYASTHSLVLTGSGNMTFTSSDAPWHQYRDDILRVTLPEGLTSIDNRAFQNCSGLTSVTIPKSVMRIGMDAFNGCTGLTSVLISNLEAWCIFSFNNYKSNPLYYAHHLYMNGSEITNLVIPNSVTSIGQYAFSGCSGLTSVTIPNSVTSIGDGAFSLCSCLTNVMIPNSVTMIGFAAFSGCSCLTNVTIPNSVTSIGEVAFCNCSGLTSATIPSSVTNIGSAAFSGCSGLNSIKVESGNTTYDSRDDCNAIIETNTNTLIAGCKNTVILNSVTCIGKRAFHGCNRLASIKIPNSVTNIGDLAFWNCAHLTSVTIGNNVTSIGNQAFYECSGLTSLTVKNPIPVSISSYTFSNSKNAVLYVPIGSKAAYMTTNYWKTFKEIVEVDINFDPTANTISIADITGNVGKQVALPIALNNQTAITGLQLDLYLPSGVTIANKSSGKMMIETTERMVGNYSISSNTIDNFVRIAGYSGDGDAFTGNSGDILNITLNIGETMTAGDYTIRIKDIVLSDVNSMEYQPADVEGTMTIKTYTLGDVDDSGTVNINDVVCIINYILNRANGTFIPEAADVDENGTININDVVTLINRYILMKDSAPAQMRVSQRASIEDNNYLHLVDIDMNPGETKEVQLMMTNAGMVAASQGNIKLPAGLSFVTKSNGRPDVKNIDIRSEDFTLSCALQDDGSMTFAQYSADGFAYTGNEGGIFTFKVKAAEDAVPGTYSVALTGVVLSINGVGYEIPDRTSPLTISEASGINSYTLDDTKNVGNYYSLDGRMLQGKPILKGIYLNNGKKVVVK